jgi:hypothetical protein
MFLLSAPATAHGRADALRLKQFYVGAVITLTEEGRPQPEGTRPDPRQR